MALVNCNNCGREVSDKATICPGCSYKLVNEAAEEKEIVLCEECGTEIPDCAEVCSKCGCPIVVQKTEEATPQKVELAAVNLPISKKITKKHKIIAIVAAIAVLLGTVIGLLLKNNSENEYYNNLEAATNLMLAGAAEAEQAGNLIKAVWYNTIYEEYDSETDKYTMSNGFGFNDDFNDSLDALFSDQTFKNQITDIEMNQMSVANIMKELQNPPEEYEDAYEAIKALYDSYLELTNLATNPSGSLRTFSDNFNNADSESLQRYESMKMYIE